MVKELSTDRGGDLEVEDDGPYEPQSKLGISVCNVIIPNVHQLDLGFSERKKNSRIYEEFYLTINIIILI